MTTHARLTRFKKARGPLTKRLHLDPATSKVSNDSSACRMSSGEARRVEISSAADLAALINSVGSNEAIAVGQLRTDLPDAVKIIVKAKLDPSKPNVVARTLGKPNVVARTLDFLKFYAGNPGALLLDHDPKGMTTKAEDRVKSLGGTLPAIAASIDGFDRCARVWRPSTSSGLINTATGEVYADIGGLHAYPLVSDVGAIPEFVTRLKARLVKLGLAWGMSSACGSFLKRYLVDMAVASPERLIFEGPPIIDPPLAQKDKRLATAIEGELLDLLASVPAETEDEDFWRREREALAPVVTAMREAWSAGHIRRLIAEGKTEAEARSIIDRWIETQDLSGAFALIFDDSKIGEVSVRDVMRDPAKYAEKPLADPFEGIAYGPGKAELFVNEDGSLIINSFAHGGLTYRLVAEPSADLDSEIERLRRLKQRSPADYERERKPAARRLGFDRVSTLDEMVKAKTKTPRERTAAPTPEERSSRPIIVLEAGETPRIVNEIEAALLASGLPLYKRGGFIVSPGVDQLPTWNKGKVVAQIIARRQASSLVETAESVAQFMRRNDKGDLIPCGLPQRYALTLMAREHHLRFPVLVAIANTPSISIDGELLDLPGFDPATGVLYDPLDVVFPRVPDLPTESEIKAALSQILCTLHTLDGDFVAPEDKGVALSLLMTSIARRGLDFAPMHGMDAPVAGSGKSMVIEIASILATGHGALVMSQGETREETEKKLGAVLMQGDPLIAIDNCDFPLEGQTLNQALTQPLVKVRILGKSEMITIQTSAVITATGNNLTPKGDLVRRTIVGRLDPKCARPELRQYNFDPIDYATNNRGQLVIDILTLLKAHHNKGRPNLPPEFQGFRRWSNTVRGCICWLAEAFPEERIADPVKTMERVRSTDPILAALKAVLVAWSDEFRDRPVTLAEAAKVAEEVTSKPVPGSFSLSHVTPANPELHDALISVAGRSGRIDVKTFGQWVGRNADRVDEVEDGRFITLTKAGVLHGTQRWRTVEKKNEGKNEGKNGDDFSCNF